MSESRICSITISTWFLLLVVNLATLQSFALTLQRLGYACLRLSAVMHCVYNDRLQFPLIRRALVNDARHVKPLVQNAERPALRIFEVLYGHFDALSLLLHNLTTPSAPP